jgi:hypothetical protein
MRATRRITESAGVSADGNGPLSVSRPSDGAGMSSDPKLARIWVPVPAGPGLANLTRKE